MDKKGKKIEVYPSTAKEGQSRNPRNKLKGYFKHWLELADGKFAVVELENGRIRTFFHKQIKFLE